MKTKGPAFDTSTEVTKKAKDISLEPEMIELKRMIRAGELDPRRIRKIEDHTPKGDNE